MKFKSDIEVQAGLRDGSDDIGTAGQLLSSTGTITNWIDQADVVAAGATRVLIACKNTSGATITKGTPVYQTGNVGATDVIEIAEADALISTGYLPAIGLLETDLINNAFGHVVITGELLNITTDPIDGLTPTTGDTIYLKSGGGLTLTKPTGEGNAIQNLGLVGKVSGGNAGSLTVASIMRQNDVPNLPTGKIWVGDGNTIVSDVVYLDETNERMGIGTTTPSTVLEVSSTGVNGVDISQSASNASQSGRLFFTTNTASEGFALFNSNGTFQVNSGGIPNNTSGTNRISIIGSSGNVGIGTTSPTNKLQVTGGSVGIDSEYMVRDNRNNTILLQSASTAASNRSLTIGNATYSNIIVPNGNVGIGTTNPTALLTLESSSFDPYPGIDIKSTNTYPGSKIRFLDSSGSEVSTIESWSNPAISYLQLNHGYTSAFSSTLTLDDGFLYLSTAGSERMRIDSSGNVGIGTTSPGAKLEVSSSSGGVLRLTSSDTSVAAGESIGRVEFKSNDASTGGNNVMGFVDCLATNAGSTYALAFGTGNAAAATEKMRINQSGNVGIGTTSPDSKLEVASTDSNTYVHVRNDSTGSTRLKMSNLSDTNSNGFQIINNGSNGQVNLLNYKASTLALWTNNSQRMTILSGGNVGIGTTSPQAKLHVANGTLRTWSPTTGTSAIFESTVNNRNFLTLTATNEAELWFGNASTQTLGRIRYEMANNNMEFWTNATQKMVINSSGNVGIGTTSPNSKLHVAGTVSLSTPLANFDGNVGSGVYGAVSVRVDNINYGTAMKFYRSLSADNNAIGFQNGASTVGSISIGASSTSYNTTSDYRLKENLTAITDGIDRLKQLKPRRFNFIGNADVVDGFIAHEAKEVIPESVTGEKDEVLPNGDPVYQGIDQAKIVPLLTAALQEAVTKIEQLETRIQTLENK